MPRRSKAERVDPTATVTLPITPRQPRLGWHGMERSELPPRAAHKPEIIEWIDRSLAPARPQPESGAAQAAGQGGPAPPPNRLILASDNLHALQALLEERDAATGAPRYRGQVDLVYIDPPFMVNSDFYAARRDTAGASRSARADGPDDPGGPGADDEPPLAYRDTWAGGLDEFLSMLRDRLVLLRELLRDTGSIYVHLDRRACHYVKVLLDEIFGYDCFRNEITWRRANAHNDPNRFGAITDAILFYVRSARADVRPYFRDVHVPYSADYVRSHFHTIEEASGRRYRLVPLDAPRHGDGGNLVYEWRGRWPAPTRTWACRREVMEELEAQGRIAYTSAGTPTLRRYLDESPGHVAQSLWDDIPPVNPMAHERLGYPTQKPLALLTRVLRASCPPGGLVLDCFAGSGTTCEAAERLGCRWIGIDSSRVAIATARRRLVRLHGQPVQSEPAAARYRTCESCSAVSRLIPTGRDAGPLCVRPFVVEACGTARSDGLGVELRATVSGRTVTVSLVAVTGPAPADRGSSARKKGRATARVVPAAGKATRPVSADLDAWSIDWQYGQRSDGEGQPILSPGWHGTRSPRGTEPLAPSASFTYAAPGRYTIAARVLDRHGRAGEARLSVDIA
ncbi:MAG: site-specific DNA-methyltransferase [Polyangia bacterium]